MSQMNISLPKLGFPVVYSLERSFNMNLMSYIKDSSGQWTSHFEFYIALQLCFSHNFSFPVFSQMSCLHRATFDHGHLLPVDAQVLNLYNVP